MRLQEVSRFMIIDDDVLNNEISRMYIKLAFPETEIAVYSDPVIALDNIAKEEQPPNTILFLDINMPVLDGWEVLDKLMVLPDSIKSHHKIFMFTSSISVADKTKAAEHPLVSGYVEKPLTIEHIENKFSFLFD